MVWIGLISTLFVILFMIVIIDTYHLRIPNSLNLTLFATGLFYAHFNDGFSVLTQACFSIAIFLFFTVLRWIYFKLRNKSGLGFGDVKMFAAASVWIDPMSFPILMLIASGAALTYFTLAHVLFSKHIASHTRLPFGPFIAVALLMVVVVEQKDLLEGIFL